MASTNYTIVRHIGIILDGNRRYAKKLAMQPWKGHEEGAKRVEDLIDWACELGIYELTLYCFSMQNFKRSEEEFNHLMRIFKDYFDRLKTDKRIKENNVRINFIGRTHLFSPELQQSMRAVMEETKDADKHIVNFALAYGGREEIVDAVKKIAEKVREGNIDTTVIDEKTISENIYLDSEPDLIIRTGGDRRTSNFLIWQSWYSEWFFFEKTWPEFTKEDLVSVVEEFSTRQRRFGK
jgi:tritrans,polycis-undecaprenyl-diphosphate synthase [geranylgeranyl-diphosphate specific]